jgi:hypothetical protein
LNKPYLQQKITAGVFPRDNQLYFIQKDVVTVVTNTFLILMWIALTGNDESCNKDSRVCNNETGNKQTKERCAVIKEE